MITRMAKRKVSLDLSVCESANLEVLSLHARMVSWDMNGDFGFCLNFGTFPEVPTATSCVDKICAKLTYFAYENLCTLLSRCPYVDTNVDSPDSDSGVAFSPVLKDGVVSKVWVLLYDRKLLWSSCDLK